jgi:hypothetical protein
MDGLGRAKGVGDLEDMGHHITVAQRVGGAGVILVSFGDAGG